MHENLDWPAHAEGRVCQNLWQLKKWDMVKVEAGRWSPNDEIVLLAEVTTSSPTP